MGGTDEGPAGQETAEKDPIPTFSAGVQVALDVGQTATKGQVLSRRDQPQEFALPSVRTNQPLRPQLTEIITAGVAEAESMQRGPTSLDVALGVSGLTAAEADAGALLASVERTPLRQIRLAHDSVTGYLGALGDARGAVVAAGTGAVTLGVGKDLVARVDGWGLMGDAGSGYWIGREAVHAAMRAYDGRGPGTSLQEAVRQRWSDLESAYIELQNDPQAVSVMASFARTVAEAASTDAVAESICRRAAAELAHSTVTALRRVGEEGETGLASSDVDRAVDGTASEGSGEEPLDIAAIGGVFRSEVIAAEFRRLIEHSVPQARVVPSRGQGIDGVVTLFGIAADHPLRQLISVAGRRP